MRDGKNNKCWWSFMSKFKVVTDVIIICSKNNITLINLCDYIKNFFIYLIYNKCIVHVFNK